MVGLVGFGKIPRLALAGVILATMVGGTVGHAAPAKAPVTLTFWEWTPGVQHEVDIFNKTHSGIHVNLVNAGQGTPEYTKLRTALKAGSGAPDVVQIEFQYLPTFELTGKLVDMGQYGADAVKNDYVDWAWAQVSHGSKVYAIPQDSGPMALLYRQDIFQKYHLTVPTTWDQFAQDASTLHKANPKLYLTDFPVGDPGWLNALMWQGGSRPFKLSGSDLTIKINDPKTMMVVNFWGDLAKAGNVQTGADFSPAWFAALANGTYASWVAAAWSPVLLSGTAAKTSGLWRAAPLPQWKAGQHIVGNWGGSTNSVTTQSAHPKEATEFAIWLNNNVQSATYLAKQLYLWPTLKSILSSPSFTDAPVAFYGGQKVHQIYAAASTQVDVSYQWSPFQDYVYSQMTDKLGAAANRKTSFTSAMNSLQDTLVSYAKNEGFSVH